MSWQTVDTLLLGVIASFATAMSNPVAWLLVLAAVAGRRRRWAARGAALAVGAAIGLLDTFLEISGQSRLAMLLGSAAAGLLLGEFVLQVMMPAWRFALRCLALVIAWLRSGFSAGPD